MKNTKCLGTRSGDPIDDMNIIIRQYIEANKQRYDSYNSMRRLYDALKVLGMRDDAIAEEYNDRKALKLYGFIENNRFQPFSVSTDVIAAYAKESEEKNIPNPLNEKVLKQLEKIQEDMFDLKLNQEFNINVEDYLLENPKTSVLPLPEQSMPNPEIMQASLPTNQNGLTVTEQALLSDEEKMIRLRDRGLA